MVQADQSGEASVLLVCSAGLLHICTCRCLLLHAAAVGLQATACMGVAGATDGCTARAVGTFTVAVGTALFSIC